MGNGKRRRPRKMQDWRQASAGGQMWWQPGDESFSLQGNNLKIENTISQHPEHIIIWDSLTTMMETLLSLVSGQFCLHLHSSVRPKSLSLISIPFHTWEPMIIIYNLGQGAHKIKRKSMALKVKNRTPLQICWKSVVSESLSLLGGGGGEVQGVKDHTCPLYFSFMWRSLPAPQCQ